MKTEMKDRIRSRRLQLDITQESLAKRLGVSRVSVTKWENGSTRPAGENLHQLAISLSTSADWLLYGKASNEPDDTKVIPYIKPPKAIPIISAVQAGMWTEAQVSERISDVMSWTQTTSDVSDQAFGLVVRGESMTNPNGLPSIPEGSIVIVEPNYGQLDNLYGKIVVAMLEGSSEATVKKLVWDSPQCYLMPLNPAFNPIPINGNCRIVGKVVQVTQNL